MPRSRHCQLAVRLTNVVSTVSRQIHEPLVKYEDTYDEILPALATGGIWILVG